MIDVEFNVWLDRRFSNMSFKQIAFKYNVSTENVALYYKLNLQQIEEIKRSILRKREMAKRKSTYKPLLFTTTIRNPTRVKSLLYVLQKYNNNILTDNLAQEIMGELIKYGLYRPTKGLTESIKSKLSGTKKGEFANELLTDEEVEYLIKQNPQNHKEAGFSSGWASRFATVFDFSKELGFVYFWHNNKIEFSEIGLKLASVYKINIVDNNILVTEEHPEFEKQAFLHAFAKYQRKNPFVRVLNDNIPMILLIEVIQKLNNNPKFNNAGISKLELPLIIFWRNNDSQELYERIVKLRKDYGYTPSWEMIIDICINEIMDNEFKAFKPKSIMNEYPDEFIRKMRITGLFSLRGGGRFIDINKKEQDTVKYIIDKYSKYKIYRDEKEYFNYMATVDTKLISFENKKLTIQENNKLLDKWVKYFNWNTLKQELKILENKSITKNDILKYLNNPTRLEFLISISIKSKFPHIEVIPNYPCDDEGIPTSTATGQGNQGDIECFEDSKGILVEVTMSEGRTQTMMEVWPITRHLEEFKKKASDSICHFIAPSIFKDTQRQIKFVKQEDDLTIVANTISDFIKYIETEEYLYTS